MRVTSGAFVAENISLHAGTFREQLGLIISRNAAAILGVLAASRVPDGENDAPLLGRVHLHAEVTARKTTGHVISRNGILDRSDLVVKHRDGFALGCRINKVHRGGIASRIEIEVSVFDCRSVKHQGIDLPFTISTTASDQLETDISRFRDLKLTKHRLTLLDRGLKTLCPDREPQTAAVIAFRLDDRTEFAGRFDLAEPQHPLFSVRPLSDALVL